MNLIEAKQSKKICFVHFHIKHKNWKPKEGEKIFLFFHFQKQNACETFCFLSRRSKNFEAKLPQPTPILPSDTGSTLCNNTPGLDTYIKSINQGSNSRSLRGGMTYRLYKSPPKYIIRDLKRSNCTGKIMLTDKVPYLLVSWSRN